MLSISVRSLLFLYFVAPGCRSSCPCDDAPLEFDHKLSWKVSNTSAESMTLCVANALPSEERLLKSLNFVDINVHILPPGNFVPAECDVVAKIIHERQATYFRGQMRLCPGICRPIPEIEFMAKWLVEGVNRSAIDDYLTCTLTSSMISRVIAQRRGNLGGEINQSASTAEISDMIRAIFWRRIMECFEKKIWYKRYTELPSPLFSNEIETAGREKMDLLKIGVARRKISCLVIWIGSQSNLNLIEGQAEVLRGQPSVGTLGVVAWAATDDIYPCRPGKINCGKKSRTKFLPQSAINYMSKGWGCAQRRPLRSLAHTLLLVDPTFAIVLDDDTYLNFQLLLSRYGTYLTQGAISQKPLVIGELLGAWGDSGHLTKWGIFAGGAGYVIGHRALQALTAKEIKYYPGEGPGMKANRLNGSDSYRSNQQIHYLSVYREGLEVSQRYCGKLRRESQSTARSDRHVINSCILTTTPVHSSLPPSIASAESTDYNLVIPIAVRLIYFCANLMANEHTCLHRCDELTDTTLCLSVLSLSDSFLTHSSCLTPLLNFAVHL